MIAALSKATLAIAHCRFLRVVEKVSARLAQRFLPRAGDARIAGLASIAAQANCFGSAGMLRASEMAPESSCDRARRSDRARGCRKSAHRSRERRIEGLNASENFFGNSSRLAKKVRETLG